MTKKRFSERNPIHQYFILNWDWRITRRLAFLWGNLTGLTFSVGLAYALLGNDLVSKQPVFQKIHPSRVAAPTSVRASPSRPPSPEIPPEWELRHFNGQPYYVVPLICENS